MQSISRIPLSLRGAVRLVAIIRIKISNDSHSKLYFSRIIYHPDLLLSIIRGRNRQDNTIKFLSWRLN
ncbi:hypothetical protein HMPREF3293_01387 [Christensenella minuta]|uniref:Uncharacterized protein n=1 Tax=Christensenella minuta TaxID=626937 RepID=A0A136Q529_9FIRM|nr:hypothetical protein HMPREF3293_01387 [Christensenella minuta]